MFSGENEITVKKPTKPRRKRNRKKRTQSEDSLSEDVKSKTYYGSHKTTILSALDSDRDETDSYCDVTLNVDGREFLAHKCILGKLSRFFDRMFKSEMKEKYDSLANIEGLNEDTMEIILSFIYSATINITEENVMDLLVASDYMQLDEIKSFCMEFLNESMDKSNCLSLQQSGSMFNCPTLTDHAQTMAAQNFEEIVQEQQFKELNKTNVVSFLKTRDQKAFGSKAVYEGALAWVKHDLDGRRDYFVELLKVAKLHLLPTSYLEDVVANEELVKESHECKDYFQSELLYRLKLPSSTQQTSESGSSKTPDSQNDDSNGQRDNKKMQKQPKKPGNGQPPKQKVDQARRSSGTSSNPEDTINQMIQLLRERSERLEGRFSGPSSNQHGVPTTFDDVAFSKEIVKIVRHGNYKDIKLNPQGFAVVQDILENRRFRSLFGKRSLEDVKRIVKTSNKKRFELKILDSKWQIRATGGHTTVVQNGDPSTSTGQVNGGASFNPDEVSYPGDVEFSKELVRILRHGKCKDIKIDSEGFADVQHILDNPKFQSKCGKITFDDIEYIVETNDKKYFELRKINSRWQIKATQGHTVKVEHLELTPITNPQKFPDVLHGTSIKAWEGIQMNGLSRMKRTHIHFATGMSNGDGAGSELKPNTELVIELDLKKAMAAGLKFFVSSNNSVLCEGDTQGRIHPKFFSKVVQLRPYKLVSFTIPPDFPTSRQSNKKNYHHRQQGKK